MELENSTDLQVAGKEFEFERRIFVRFHSVTKLKFSETGLNIKKNLKSEKAISYSDIVSIEKKNTINPSSLWVALLFGIAAIICFIGGKAVIGIIASLICFLNFLFIREIMIVITTSSKNFKIKISKNDEKAEEFLNCLEYVKKRF